MPAATNLTPTRADLLEDLLQAGYRYALALARHPEDAEDLVQQGWLKLYRRHGGVRHLPMLFTTIRNLFYDQLRRDAKLSMVSLDELPDGPIGIDDCCTVPNLRRLELERLLGELRAREREVIFLHYVLGYTAAEISRLTGVPRGSVLSLLHRAKRKLYAALTPANEDSEV